MTTPPVLTDLERVQKCIPSRPASKLQQRRGIYQEYLEALTEWGCTGPVVAALRRALARLEKEGDDRV